MESSRPLVFHTIPDRFLPSSRNCTHRYRPVSIDIDSIHWNTARVTTDIYLQDIYIYLFYLLFVLPPPTRSTNLTRIFFASSLERTEGGLTRGRKRMEDKQRMVIDGWERLEGGGGGGILAGSKLKWRWGFSTEDIIRLSILPVFYSLEALDIPTRVQECFQATESFSIGNRL